MHQDLFLYHWNDSRQAHSRIIQIIDVKHRMGDTVKNLQSQLTHYFNEFGELPLPKSKFQVIKN